MQRERALPAAAGRSGSFIFANGENGTNPSQSVRLAVNGLKSSQIYTILSPKGGGFMKKAVYYISPFVIIPIIFLITSILESVEIFKPIAPHFAFTTLFLFAVIIGAISQSKAKFDYIITAIVPLSVFYALFISLLFDEGCNGTPQFSLHHALNIEYYRSWLPIALIMMVIAFVFSFKPIRNFIKSKVSSKKSAK